MGYYIKYNQRKDIFINKAYFSARKTVQNDVTFKKKKKD